MVRFLKFVYIGIIVFLLSFTMASLQGCRESDIETDVSTDKELENLIISDKNMSELFDDNPNEAVTEHENVLYDVSEQVQILESAVDSASSEENNYSEPVDSLIPLTHENESIETADYTVTENTQETKIRETEQENNKPESIKSVTYVLNKNSKKFHYEYCSSVSNMSEKNKAFDTNRDSIISKGYQPCKRCNP